MCHSLKQQNTYYGIFEEQLTWEYYSRRIEKMKLQATPMLIGLETQKIKDQSKGMPFNLVVI
jgi:hypothetical protein